MLKTTLGSTAILVGLLAAPSFAHAQWLHHPDAKTPRTADGKPNLSAPAPRGPDGKPDLSGVWQPEGTPIPELLRALPGAANRVAPPSGSEAITKYFADILVDFKPEEAPLQPGVVSRTDDPALRCLPVGMPMFDTYPAPRKIVQAPGLIMMLTEADVTFRQIFTDGRKVPEDSQPAWLGYSVGRWEGDTLVAETEGINERTTLDSVGHTHSGSLRVTERFRRVNFGRVELQLTLTDPRTFTKPLTVKFNLVLFPDTDLIESFCSENEKDLSHTPGQSTIASR